jgi:hypothetical protein
MENILKKFFFKRNFCIQKNTTFAASFFNQSNHLKIVSYESEFYFFIYMYII